MPDCARCDSGLEETAEHAFYYCERVREFWDHVGEWTARIEPKQLVLLDVGYFVDNVLPPFKGVVRTVIWTTRKKGLYDDANFSHRDLILYFRHQLRVKIRCDRKRLDRITFSRRWVNAARLVVRKWAMLESSFPPLPAHGVYGTGSSGPHPRVSRHCFFSSLKPSQQYVVSHHPRHLVVSSQDLPIPIIFAPQPYPSPLLLKILKVHMYKNHITCFYVPIPHPTLYFFAPLDQDPRPTQGRSDLFSLFSDTGKTVGLHFCRRGIGGQPILYFCIFRCFSPIPII